MTECTETNRLCHGTAPKCGAKSTHKWTCTRDSGYTGDHVACGLDHNLEVWPNESDPSTAAPAPAVKPTDGGYAFPVSNPITSGETYRTSTEHANRFNGMTLRDYFAGQALAGMHANDTFMRALSAADPNTPKETVCKAAYEIADAMLAARDARPEGK